MVFMTSGVRDDWQYVDLVVLLWHPALLVSSSSVSVTAVR